MLCALLFKYMREDEMIGFLRDWLRPTASGAEMAHRQYILNLVLLVLAVPGMVFGVLLVVLWQIGLIKGAFLIVGLGVHPFYLLAYYLGRQGRVTLAAYVVVGSLFLVMAGATLYGGIGHITMIGLAIVTAVASTVLGFRVALVLTVLSSGLYLGVGLYQIARGLPQAVRPEATLIPDVIGFALALLVLALLNWFSKHELRKSFSYQRTAEFLRRSNEQYRAIFDAMGDWIHVVDTDLRIVLCNTAMKQVLQGLGLETDVIGKSVMSVFSFLPERVLDEYHQVIVSQTPLVTEERLMLGEQLVLTETRKIPVLEGGEVVHVVTAVRDITAHRQAEAALQESERRYRRLVEISPDSIVLTDLEANILICNQQTAAFHGFETPEEVVGRNAFELIASEDLPKAKNNLLKALSGNDVAAVEYSMTRRDGSLFFAELNAALVLDADGEPQAFIGVTRDVSKRKLAEIALQRYMERLETQVEIGAAILEARSPTSIAQAALVHLRSLVPYTWASVADVDLLENIGKDLVVYDRESERGYSETFYPLANAGAIVTALRGGQTHACRDLNASAERVPMEKHLHTLGVQAYFSVPLIADEKLIGALTLGFAEYEFTSDDVEIAQEVAASLAVALRQARLYTQTQEDARIKTELLREVNHRVGNNLTALLGILNVEANCARQEKQSAVLDVLERLICRVEGLACVHRTLSKSQWRPVPLDNLATEILNAALNALPPDKHVQVDVASTSVLVSPRQASNLALIFNELVTNTIKYGFDTRAEACVTVWVERDAEWVKLIYQDDGPGYEEAVLEGSKHSIGLYLVQQLMKTLRGELHLSNDNGAVTQLYFPAATEFSS